VPLTSLGDMDVTSPAFFARPDYYEVLARLRAEAPVSRSTPDTWIVTRYEDIRAISRDPARFSSRRGVIINDPARRHPRAVGSGSVIHMDPPEHSAYRKLVNGEFTPRAVGRLEDAIRATVRQVFDGVAVGEEVDAVGSLTAPIPVLVIARLLGVEDGDLADFRRWSDAMIEFSDSPSDEGQTAGVELFTFLGRHIATRYEQPGDDIISLLTGSSFQGSALSEEQILMFCLTLLVAGNETTRHLLSGGIQALAAHPEQRARLTADPDLIPQAVEEMLRWVTPIQAMGRTANHALEFAGQEVAEGDYLVMLYASGNRDAEAFGPTADRFDVGRPVSPTHVAFGFGEHLCLGAPLARLEARIFWEEALVRYPHFQVTGEPVMAESTLVRGAKRLPVVLRG
jgi:cytochrome P450